MNHYAMRCELKNNAKDNLTGKYGIVILGFFLFQLILVGIRLIFSFPYFIDTMMAMVTGGSYSLAALRLSQFGDLLSQIFSGLLQFGLAYLCLNIICHRRFQYKDVFFGFRKEYLVKILILSSVTVLINYACFLPCRYLTESFLSTRSFSRLTAAVFALIIGGCVYVPISLALNLTYYLLLDFPDRKAITLIRDSFRVIKGHRRRFFLLQCSFIPLYVICELTFGIGFLWLTPYMQMTFALFYLELMNPKTTNK